MEILVKDRIWKFILKQNLLIPGNMEKLLVQMRSGTKFQ